MTHQLKLTENQLLAFTDAIKKAADFCISAQSNNIIMQGFYRLAFLRLHKLKHRLLKKTMFLKEHYSFKLNAEELFSIHSLQSFFNSEQYEVHPLAKALILEILLIIEPKLSSYAQ